MTGIDSTDRTSMLKASGPRGMASTHGTDRHSERDRKKVQVKITIPRKPPSRDEHRGKSDSGKCAVESKANMT
jgi:hypothetical protein